MTFDLTQIIVALFALLSAIITAVVVPLIRSKTTAAQQDLIAYWVSVAVSAAEMLFTGGGRGEEKLNYVIEQLADKGLNVDEQTLRALIEAAVLELKKA